MLTPVGHVVKLLSAECCRVKNIKLFCLRMSKPTLFCGSSKELSNLTVKSRAIVGWCVHTFNSPHLLENVNDCFSLLFTELINMCRKLVREKKD